MGVDGMLHRDDVPGYVMDEIHKFIKERDITKDNMRRLTSTMSIRYGAADLGIELIKMVLNGENNGLE